MKSLDHRYAEVAFECISSLHETSNQTVEYGRLCHTFPSMVLLNGLRLTVAFFQSKTNVHQQYLNHLAKAIEKEDWDLPEDAEEYRHLSRCALRASLWFKRYSEAILKVKQAQE
ncbi:type III-B CRISPR module-associated protein Cmr5 [Cohnella laeviribosi]|uniref:type III-B CRISPR module-associated protein Cmr5 n=1 Tax=Cohnella laeviribosi TaxID=380174 RepID=UPI003D213EB7